MVAKKKAKASKKAKAPYGSKPAPTPEPIDNRRVMRAIVVTGEEIKKQK